VTLQLVTADVAVPDYLEETIVYVLSCFLCFVGTKTIAAAAEVFSAVSTIIAVPGLFAFFYFHPAVQMAMVVDAAAPAAKKLQALSGVCFAVKKGDKTVPWKQIK